MYNLDISDFHQVTNHPVHILNVNETFSPSAFIPFCAFGEDMKAMGKEVDGFDHHVCNSFKAKIRNDQLCYEVNLEEFKDKDNINEQLKSGLVLILDYNEERQSETYKIQGKMKKTRFRGIEENDVLIFLDTKSKVVQVFAYLFIQIFRSCNIARRRGIQP